MSAPTAEERGLATPGMSDELVDHIARLQVERDIALVKLGSRRVRIHTYNGRVRTGWLEAAVHVAGGLIFIDERNHKYRVATHQQVEIVAFNEIDTYKSPLIVWMEAL